MDNEQALRQKLIERVTAAATMLAVDVRGALRDATPRSQQGQSHTADQWTATPPTFDGQAITFTVRNQRAQIIEWLRFGTQAHWILPVKARALHWVGPGGEDVFARRVFHRGTTGNDFLYGPEGVLAERNLSDMTRAAFERTRR